MRATTLSPHSVGSGNQTKVRFGNGEHLSLLGGLAGLKQPLLIRTHTDFTDCTLKSSFSSLSFTVLV